jgi:ubiquinone/menaquinone biosynthesis C-methylase UbiE
MSLFFRNVFLVLPVIFAGLVHADGPAKSGKKPNRYEFRQEHDPDGIGKFYLGREIAQVMGHQGAGWLERPEREKEEHCSKLLPALKIKPGDFVADIGAGSGFYTFPLSKIVGPKGRVFAVDIQPEMLKIIRFRMRKWDLKNIQPVLGKIADPKLRPASIDLILMVDVYHEFSYPYEMTQELVKALKPKGRLVFVEYRLEDDKVPIKIVHKMSQKQVKKEMAPFPLRHVETLNHLPWQHVIIFEKKEEKLPKKLMVNQGGKETKDFRSSRVQFSVFSFQQEGN